MSLRDEIKRYLMVMWDSGYKNRVKPTFDDTADAILKAVRERLPKGFCSRVNEHDGGGTYLERAGYNQALNDVREILK